jgi:hypothetical protein
MLVHIIRECEAEVLVLRVGRLVTPYGAHQPPGLIRWGIWNKCSDSDRVM